MSAAPVGSGLFGTKPSTPFPAPFPASNPSAGIFGPSTTSQPVGQGLFGQQSQTQGDQSDKNAQEIAAVLQNHAAQIDPTSNKNAFVFCMYNKYGKQVTAQLKDQIKNSFPVKDIAAIPENTKITGEATGMKQLEVFVNQK